MGSTLKRSKKPLNSRKNRENFELTFTVSQISVFSQNVVKLRIDEDERVEKEEPFALLDEDGERKTRGKGRY